MVNQKSLVPETLDKLVASIFMEEVLEKIFQQERTN